MNSKLLLSFFCLVLFVSCTKNTPDHNQPSLVAPADHATAIAFQTFYENGRYITVYEPNGTLRWRDSILTRNGWHQDMTYSEGRLLFNLGDELVAYNLAGGLAWKSQNLEGINSNPGFYMGKMYTASSNGNLYEIQPENGMAKRLRNIINLVPITPVIKDSILYAFSATYLAYYSMTAVDLRDKNIKWTKGIGYNPPQNILQAGNLMLSGNNLGAYIEARDIKTGELLWYRQDIDYTQTAIAGNRLYGVASKAPYGIIAIDLQTGTTVWKYGMFPITGSIRTLYQYGDKVYFHVYEGDRKNSYISLDTSNGNFISRRQGINSKEIIRSQLAGDKLYQFENLYEAPVNNFLMMVYRADNFTVADSFSVPGNYSQYLRVIKKSDN